MSVVVFSFFFGHNVFSAILLVTLFIQRLQTFFKILVTRFTFLKVFKFFELYLHLCLEL